MIDEERAPASEAPSHELLAAIGLLLYGPDWRPALADGLGVHPRTMARWASGFRDIPAGVFRELSQLLAKQGARRVALLIAQANAHALMAGHPVFAEPDDGTEDEG